MLNYNFKDLKIGQKVTSDFIPCNSKVERILFQLEPAEKYGSGYKASAHGAICKECGHVIEPLLELDASWFFPVEDKKKLSTKKAVEKKSSKKKKNK